MYSEISLDPPNCSLAPELPHAGRISHPTCYYPGESGSRGGLGHAPAIHLDAASRTRQDVPKGFQNDLARTGGLDPFKITRRVFRGRPLRPGLSAGSTFSPGRRIPESPPLPPEKVPPDLSGHAGLARSTPCPVPGRIGRPSDSPGQAWRGSFASPEKPRQIRCTVARHFVQ